MTSRFAVYLAALRGSGFQRSALITIIVITIDIIHDNSSRVNRLRENIFVFSANPEQK